VWSASLMDWFIPHVVGTDHVSPPSTAITCPVT
jgi:hypothetical protein